MTEPIWLRLDVINQVHEMQLAEHGGAPGVRDAGLLESALAHPINAYAYGMEDLCSLAARYAFALCRNHPFVDGNKRTAFLAAYVFLRLNGRALVADQIEAARAVRLLASGAHSVENFADWLRRHVSVSQQP